jgi:hypothetical protein
LRYLVPRREDLPFYLPEALPDEAVRGGGDDEGETEGRQEDDVYVDENDEIAGRVVVLFNTWQEQPEGVAVSSSLSLSSSASAFRPPLLCEPRGKWLPVTVAEAEAQVPSDQPGTILALPLLGDSFRRGRADNALVLTTRLSAAAVTGAFTSPAILITFAERETRYLETGEL